MAIHIVGGGLAGTEAAWQCLRQGFNVILHEMRPQRTSAAHQTDALAELVCSNTLKSKNPESAPGQLKREMQALDSLIIRAAYIAEVPAGQALGVDRTVFSQVITETLSNHPNFEMRRAEVTEIPSQEELTASGDVWIVATGPLSSEAIVSQIRKRIGDNAQLYFYDAIAPIIAADSINREFCFRADRYGETGKGDYLNIPLSKEEYLTFVADILAAEKMPLHDFENTKYFEACLPIEVMAERGVETLRFGPLKPVGFADPKTGRRPWAVIQLRQENVEATMYSLVGFQTKMKWPEQQRVLQKFPALKNAEFYRLGSVHRNTYFESPKVLAEDLSLRAAPHIFLAGQMTGVEGYTESAAMGLLAGLAAGAKVRGKTFAPPPRESVLGSLYHYITKGGLGLFQPMNANFGLLPPLASEKKIKKTDKKRAQCEIAAARFHAYLQNEIPASLA